MRLEKNFPTWYRELRPIYGGFEAGMDRFIDLTKNDFIGREAAMEEKRTGGKLRRVSMIVDAGDADVLGDEPIWHKGKVVGWVTSGGFAHFVDKSMAQGYVPKELADDTAARAPSRSRSSASSRKATIITDPPFDPEGRADALLSYALSIAKTRVYFVPHHLTLPSRGEERSRQIPAPRR